MPPKTSHAKEEGHNNDKTKKKKLQQVGTSVRNNMYQKINTVRRFTHNATPPPPQGLKDSKTWKNLASYLATQYILLARFLQVLIPMCKILAGFWIHILPGCRGKLVELKTNAIATENLDATRHHLQVHRALSIGRRIGYKVNSPIRSNFRSSEAQN